MSPAITVVDLSAATVSAMSPRSELLDGPREGPNWTVIGIVILAAFVVACFTMGWFWHRYQGNKNAKRIAKREQEVNDRAIGLRTFLAADSNPQRVEEGRGGWRGLSNALDAQFAETQRENDRMYAAGINPYGESNSMPAPPAAAAPSSSRFVQCTPEETRFPVVPTLPAGTAPTPTVGRRSKFEERFDESYNSKYSKSIFSRLNRPRNSVDTVRMTLAERRGNATPSTPTPMPRNLTHGGPTTK